VLRRLLVVLAVALLVQSFFLVRFERRLQVAVQRADNVAAMDELNLGQAPGRLLLVSSSELGFSLQDTRTLQSQVLAWFESWQAEHGIEPELGEMLAGVLSNHVSSYADVRLQAELGAVPGGQQPDLARSLQRRCYRTVDLLLGAEQGARFREDFEPAWLAWTGDL
jgi:hypothetical protein